MPHGRIRLGLCGLAALCGLTGASRTPSTLRADGTRFVLTEGKGPIYILGRYQPPPPWDAYGPIIAHVNLAHADHVAGRIPEAVHEYQNAAWMAIHAHNDRDRSFLLHAQTQLAVIFSEAGRLDMAQQALEAVLGFNVGYGPAGANLAGVLIRKKQYVDAITVIDRTLRYLDHGSSVSAEGKLYFNRGLALTELGDCPNANFSFERAARIDADVVPFQCQSH